MTATFVNRLGYVCKWCWLTLFSISIVALPTIDPFAFDFDFRSAKIDVPAEPVHELESPVQKRSVAKFPKGVPTMSAIMKETQRELKRDADLGQRSSRAASQASPDESGSSVDPATPLWLLPQLELALKTAIVVSADALTQISPRSQPTSKAQPSPSDALNLTEKFPRASPLTNNLERAPAAPSDLRISTTP